MVATVQASDRQRERDYAEMLQAKPLLGQVVWLQSGQSDFLGLFTEAEKTDNRMAAIIVHDAGEHPDQPPLIHQLRRSLPLHNWSSLSVQMPIREIGAPVDDYFPLFDQARERLDAAIAYLQQRGAKQIAVIGYGMGAAMVGYALQVKPSRAMAVGLISMPLFESALPQAKTAELLQALNLPILDIYGEFDLPEVTTTARQRRMIAKANPVYRQIMLDGESHGFANDPGLLVKRVYSWLALIAAEK